MLCPVGYLHRCTKRMYGRINIKCIGTLLLGLLGSCFQNVQLFISSKVPLNLFPIKCMTSLYLKKKHTLRERGSSRAVWSSSIEGCAFLCFQIRNGKQTAILAVAVEGAKGKKDAEKNKKDQFYTIYRPNTGLQVW